ncbi:uncharacterized protein SPSC_02144 [Sporisorium scitamineum]|uniref:Uncharacterized protein n=1 Tax=Sporisorium scitamineum TaxID=49012 RepID=A0A0F7S1N4_9BASI|nr:uncharacterized protein SPSC_02144 [Sporisorium scitamineum]CDW96782.1 hypothetical protein [Sporisorium scitamineum]
MKSFTTLLAFTLFALNTVLSAPMPSSSVVLQLKNGRTARCDLPQQPSRDRADMVSSKLVATYLVACPGVQEHSAGGKTVTCEQSQLADAEVANSMLRDACATHQGSHSVA